MDIVKAFLEIAKLNTSIKIETCALLCGVETADNYLITHLMVPR